MVSYSSPHNGHTGGSHSSPPAEPMIVPFNYVDEEIQTTPTVVTPGTRPPLGTQKKNGEPAPTLSSIQSSMAGSRQLAADIEDLTGKPKVKRSTKILLIGGAILFGLMFSTLSATFGFTNTIVPTIMAVMPLTAVYLCVRWIGKWSPEPTYLRFFAFIWGAGVSIALTMFLSLILEIIMGRPADLFEGSVIQAPIIEELTKGLGLLVLVFVFRKYFTGPVDGIIYISLIGAGFAFTENILYFGETYLYGTVGDLTFIFILRGIFSPLAHTLFSIPMGIAVGIAVQRNWKPIFVTLSLLISYPLSVVFHGLWNGVAFTSDEQSSWFTFYFIIQVPIFILALVVAVFFRRQEVYITLKSITAYGHQGWFTKSEVEALATWHGRKKGLAWAKRTGNRDILFRLKSLFQNIVHLAMVRESLTKTTNPLTVARLRSTEEVLLQHITTSKQLLYGTTRT